MFFLIEALGTVTPVTSPVSRMETLLGGAYLVQYAFYIACAVSDIIPMPCCIRYYAHAVLYQLCCALIPSVVLCDWRSVNGILGDDRGNEWK